LLFADVRFFGRIIGARAAVRGASPDGLKPAQHVRHFLVAPLIARDDGNA
jgi:hypothetical protein